MNCAKCGREIVGLISVRDRLCFKCRNNPTKDEKWKQEKDTTGT